MKHVYTVHTAHNAQNVAHYHCSKDLLATVLDFPNHRFFLAAKLRKASQIWRFCPAVRLVVFCQFYSTFHCLSVIWITKLQWLFEKLLDISTRLC